jgi:hypothetical protein
MQAKRIFEGESCALSYNEDQDWFDDEDEEFVFTNSNQWFEDAFVDGMMEREEMLCGYKKDSWMRLYKDYKML